jgi:NADH:ubiquinone oxidoreductase subunit 3 (subunit A)
MAPATTPPPPGSMTVPPLFGWELITVVLLLFVALAVTFFVLSATGRNKSERRELQAWLDARSYGSGEPATDLSDASTTLSGHLPES